MKRVTKNIDPGCARELLERIPRACISFACGHGPQAQPLVVWPAEFLTDDQRG